MAAIVGFLVLHVSLALIVPRTLINMLAGGPDLSSEPKAHPQSQAHQSAKLAS
jgi:hypothetical protein